MEKEPNDSNSNARSELRIGILLTLEETEKLKTIMEFEGKTAHAVVSQAIDVMTCALEQ